VAREKRLLNPKPTTQLDPLGKQAAELKQPVPKELGDCAVVVIATRTTTLQFTISRPIGVTDLAEDDWVINRSELIPGMLARAGDPDQAKLNQSRVEIRTQLAVDAKLLNKVTGADGKVVMYYPHREDASRNALLEQARAMSKEAVGQQEALIAQLKADKEKQREYQKATSDLARMRDPVEYLDEVTALAETKLREFWSQPEIEKEIARSAPQIYRTLGGPYGNLPQVAAPGSKGLTVEAVAMNLAKNLARGMAVSPGLSQTPSGYDGPTYADVTSAGVAPTIVAAPKKELDVDVAQRRKTLVESMRGRLFPKGKRADSAGDEKVL
jgi:uncharacterized tellurite resistance protein B-like protein